MEVHFLPILCASLVALFGSQESSLSSMNGQKPNQGVAFGVLTKESGYAYTWDGRPDPITKKYSFPRAVRWSRGDPQLVSERKLLMLFEPWRYSMRWRVKQDCFWIVDCHENQVTYPPVADMLVLRIPCIDVWKSNASIASGQAKAFNSSNAGHEDIFKVSRKYRFYAVGNVILQLYMEDPRGIRDDDASNPKNGSPFYYDFVPLTKDEILFFVLRLPLPRIEVFRLTRSEKHQTPEKEVINVPFKEGFHCHVTDSGTYYFVTDSGLVYRSAKSTEGHRKVEGVWTDSKQPIVALINDSEQGKAYVFGKPAAGATNAKEFFFELDEKPDVRYFDRASIKPVKNEEPLKTVMEYAQLIRGSSKPEK